MQLITHQNHIDALPGSNLKTHITARFNQLSEDTDVPPNLVLAEQDDDITGSDYAFVGPNGLLSDLFKSTSQVTSHLSGHMNTLVGYRHCMKRSF
jgi:hypothetical protein